MRKREAKKTLGQAGETAFLQSLARTLPGATDMVVGPGDDCAVVRPPGGGRMDWLLTSDAVVEGVHFLPDADPAAVGHKAVGRALSDIAAMGGRPAWLLLNLSLPSDTPLAWLRAFYRGARRLAGRCGCTIAGGDLARTPRTHVHVFAVGHVPRGQARLRSGARPGDIVFVTGTLGGSGAGRHLSFEPRLEAGVHVRRWATALMDVSDGLATDLRHLIARSGVGAELDEAALPLSPVLKRRHPSASDHRIRVEHALCDGEDYELLFTVPAAKRTAFVRSWRRKFDLPCTPIGRITARTGRLLCVGAQGERRVLHKTGFAHFGGEGG